MSPPIKRQKCRLMARPRPVPPYLRVVEASACENLEQPTHLLFGHADSSVGYSNRDPVAAIDLMRPRSNGDGAVFRELVGVAR